MGHGVRYWHGILLSSSTMYFWELVRSRELWSDETQGTLARNVRKAPPASSSAMYF